MTLLSRTLLAVSSLTVAAQALPNVVPVQAGYECSAYPKEDWTIEINQCTNSTSEEPCDIEGFHNNVQVISGDWDGYLGGQGFISIVPDKELPANKLRCTIGSRSTVMFTVWAQENENHSEFFSLGVYDVEGSEFMAWGAPGPIDIPKPYFHFDEAGTKQEGVFLGHNNITSWGVKYREARPDSMEKQPFWSVRLLGPGNEDPSSGQELGEGESATFLRVSGT